MKCSAPPCGPEPRQYSPLSGPTAVADGVPATPPRSPRAAGDGAPGAAGSALAALGKLRFLSLAHNRVARLPPDATADCFITVRSLGDVACAVAPIGLLLGRLANFINGELWGRPADVPWAMVFPGAGPLPRHPSQLYEAALEGIVLLAVLAVLVRAVVRLRMQINIIRGNAGFFLCGSGDGPWRGLEANGAA